MTLIDDYITKQQNFIKEEQRIETEEYEKLYEEHTLKDLSNYGYVLTNQKLIKKKSIFLKKSILIFQTKNLEKFPDNIKIKINDNVIINKSLNLEKNSKTEDSKGVVYKLKADCIHILTNEENEKKFLNPIFTYNIFKSYDDVTYNRIRLFFKDLKKYDVNNFSNSILVRNIMTNNKNFSNNQKNEYIFQDNDLNLKKKFQKKKLK